MTRETPNQIGSRKAAAMFERDALDLFARHDYTPRRKRGKNKNKAFRLTKSKRK